MGDLLKPIAYYLHGRYSKKYPDKNVQLVFVSDTELSPLGTQFKCAIWFWHSNGFRRPFLRINFCDTIVLSKNFEVSRPEIVRTMWQEVGRVFYEDPEMEENLDLLIDDAI